MPKDNDANSSTSNVVAQLWWWLHEQGRLHCWQIVGSIVNQLFTWTEHWTKELFRHQNQSSHSGWSIHKLIIIMQHHVSLQTCMDEVYCFDSPCNTLIIMFAEMHYWYSKHLAILPCDDFKQNLEFRLLPCSNCNLLQNAPHLQTTSTHPPHPGKTMSLYSTVISFKWSGYAGYKMNWSLIHKFVWWNSKRWCG